MENGVGKGEKHTQAPEDGEGDAVECDETMMTPDEEEECSIINKGPQPCKKKYKLRELGDQKKKEVGHLVSHMTISPQVQK